MKYKIEKNTETFRQLMAIKEEIVNVQSEARKLLKELGGTHFKEAVGVLAGGISEVRFDAKSVPGWAKSRGGHFFRPAVSNKELQAKLNNLPVVEFSDLNAILKFKSQYISHPNGIEQINFPDLNFRQDFILISVPAECEYTPPSDLTEILESEYIKLFRQSNEKIGV